MQSKRKSNSVVTHTVDDSGKIEFKSDVGSFIVDMMVLSADIDFKMLPPLIQRAAIHGVIQKVSDRAAIGRDPETGASATPEEKFAAMKECADRLMNGGPWNAVQTGAGPVGGLLYRAMRNLYPNAWSDKTSFSAYIVQKAISESERLKKKVTESDVRAGLMATKKIAKEVSRIRAEEGGVLAQMDTNGMLQELEAK